MEIESISFDSFQTLTNCPHVQLAPDNHGCQWYAAGDRRVAGRIHLDPKRDAFAYSVLHFTRERWEIKESRESYADFQQAEDSLLDAMRRESGWKEVTVRMDVPARMRFGKRFSSNQEKADG